MSIAIVLAKRVLPRFQTKESFVGASERKRELRRRRKRREKLAHWKAKLPKATQSEKLEIVRKLREASPGAEQLIVDWELVEADR